MGSYTFQTGSGKALLTVPCPKCGNKLRYDPRQIQCESCDFALWTAMANRRFETSELERLIADKSIGPLQGFRSRTGKPFTATIRLSTALRVEFIFDESALVSTVPS